MEGGQLPKQVSVSVTFFLSFFLRWVNITILKICGQMTIMMFLIKRTKTEISLFGFLFQQEELAKLLTFELVESRHLVII
jgi:hypothetical protein